MSQIEVLPIPASLRFPKDTLPRSPYPAADKLPWTAAAAGTLSSPSLSPVHSSLVERKGSAVPDLADIDDDVVFPDLPPVFHGHSDIHLREGVMRAARLAADGEPDAEKAFFVADLSYVYLQHQRWVRMLPDIEPFYAVKCNPDPYVIRLLAGLGVNFDCASNGEITKVLGTGVVDPARIIYANPCKAASHLRQAASAGVDLMTFDNADELYKVKRVHPRARLVLRILTDDSSALCRLGLKFGAPLEAVPGLLAKARELALDVVGVSFHVGSGCKDPAAFADAVARADAAFDMGAAAGYAFGLLDVGGGFEEATFEATAGVLRDALAARFSRARRPGVRVIAEPGRYYVSRAFSLAANIIARRVASDDGGGDAATTACAAGAAVAATTAGPAGSVVEQEQEPSSVMYYINDGVYGAFNCILFDHQTVHPRVLSLSGSFHVPAAVMAAGARACSVWGPTCDSIDRVCEAAVLPGALQVGDWLAFDGMGAYTVCAASEFNGFAVSEVVYTAGGGAAAAETRRVLRAVAEEVEVERGQ